MNIKKDGYFLIFEKPNDDRTVRYNLKDKKLEVYRNRTWVEVKNQYSFFSDVTVNDLVFEDKRFEKFILQIKSLNPKCSNVSTFVTKIEDYHFLEGFIQYGVEVEIRVGRHKYNGVTVSHCVSDFDRNVINFFRDNKITLTISFEREYFSNKDTMKQIVEVLSSCDFSVEQFKNFLVLYDSYSFRDALYDLIKVYRCNVKSLLEYLFLYVEPFEGLNPRDGIFELKDYLRIARLIGRDVVKYPKYLRSMHDIMVANYRSFKKDYDDSYFVKFARTDLLFEDSKFVVVLPDCSKDVVREGTSLNHCVGSYVDKIISGDCYICFLRSVSSRDVSLVTLEIKGTSLIQAKGSYNRSLRSEEFVFLRKFCKEKNLNLDVKCEEELLVVD